MAQREPGRITVLPRLWELSMRRAAGELTHGRNGDFAYGPLPQAEGGHAEPTLLARVLRGNAGIIAGIADDWRSLCSAGPCDQPFFVPSGFTPM